MILISHRGYSKTYPENTLLAFEKSIEADFSWIELDIALSQDGHIVVIHDETVDRTSNAKGSVDSYSLKELKAFDFGSWKHSAFIDEKIPTLEEVLTLFGNQLQINIEIKSGIFRHDKTQIADQLFQLLTRFNLFETTLISSFQYEVLDYLSKQCDRFRLGYLVNQESQDTMEKLLEQCHFFSLHISKERADQNWVSFCQQRNLKMFVYTVNRIDDYNRLQKLNVDGIFTDQNKRYFLNDETAFCQKPN